MNLTPSQDQWMAVIRQLLPILGTLATSLGLLTAEQVGTYTALILTIAGPCMIVMSMIWSLIANTKASIMKSVVQMPETEVSPSGKTITIHGHDLQTTAAENATPPAGPGP